MRGGAELPTAGCANTKYRISVAWRRSLNTPKVAAGCGRDVVIRAVSNYAGRLCPGHPLVPGSPAGETLEPREESKDHFLLFERLH